MSMALCLMCGSIKIGAFCGCDECGAEATGNNDLDLLFSEWQMSEELMEELSKVIVKINTLECTQTVRFYTFLAYMSKEHSDILQVDVPYKFSGEVEKTLVSFYKLN